MNRGIASAVPFLPCKKGRIHGVFTDAVKEGLFRVPFAQSFEADGMCVAGHFDGGVFVVRAEIHLISHFAQAGGQLLEMVAFKDCPINVLSHHVVTCGFARLFRLKEIPGCAVAGGVFHH